MSPHYLPSIFHNRNKQKDTTSVLSRRATTISSTNQLEEIPSLQRSNTTLSKVKRLGSLLVRNNSKKNERRRADTIFPPNIDTTALPHSNYSLSTSSTNNVSSDEEEDVLTPTTTNHTIPSHIFDFEPLHDEPVNQEPIDTVTQQTEIIEKDVIPEPNEPETTTMPIVVDPDTLSPVSLVRYHLELALAEVDEEIENELELHREQMLQNIQAKPTYLF